jgi:hypothetical protein
MKGMRRSQTSPCWCIGKYWKKVGSLRALQTTYDITQNVADSRHYLVGREDIPSDKFITIAVLDLNNVSGNHFGYQNLFSNHANEGSRFGSVLEMTASRTILPSHGT